MHTASKSVNSSLTQTVEVIKLDHKLQADILLRINNSLERG